MVVHRLAEIAEQKQRKNPESRNEVRTRATRPGMEKVLNIYWAKLLVNLVLAVGQDGSYWTA